MKIYKTNKKVLSLKNNPARFLNGITSNDIVQPQNAFLTIHGKLVATFDQVKVGDDEFYLLIEDDFVDSVLDHIDHYVKLSGVTVDEEEDETVYFDLDNSCHTEPGEVVIPQKKGKLIVAPRKLKNNVFDEEFTIFRLKNNIPLLGVDYRDDFILNISMTDFVSFTKGCYLGQEPVSKVHNRSKPTWKLMVKYENDCTEEEKAKMTSRIVDPMTGDVFGFVFAKND